MKVYTPSGPSVHAGSRYIASYQVSIFEAWPQTLRRNYMTVVLTVERNFCSIEAVTGFISVSCFTPKGRTATVLVGL